MSDARKMFARSMSRCVWSEVGRQDVVQSAVEVMEACSKLIRMDGLNRGLSRSLLAHGRPEISGNHGVTATKASQIIVCKDMADE